MSVHCCPGGHRVSSLLSRGSLCQFIATQGSLCQVIAVQGITVLFECHPGCHCTISFLSRSHCAILLLSRGSMYTIMFVSMCVCCVCHWCAAFESHYCVYMFVCVYMHVFYLLHADIPINALPLICCCVCAYTQLAVLILLLV